MATRANRPKGFPKGEQEEMSKKELRQNAIAKRLGKMGPSNEKPGSRKSGRG